MTLDLQDISAVTRSAEVLQGTITGYSIDTRTIQGGDLFFALRGERLDGHEYLSQAFEKGAQAAVVDREVAVHGNLLHVPDTIEALQALAGWARQRSAMPVVAVTGSAGKTTTKDVIAALLGVRFRTGRTVGNFNNHIGLPLSILRLPDDAEIAVLEMGMNHAGEIRDLARIGRPDVAVVTNAGYAHIENFESVESVAAAKRELVEGLKPDGTAVLNADDARVKAFRHVHPGRTVLFGLSEDADVRAEDVALSDAGVRFRVGGTQFESPMPGRHGVRNVLAGIAVAQIFGIPLPELVDAVRQLAPGKMRGERFVREGITILNDCYNSNPDAARSMIDVLKDVPAQRHIAVLGEMLELGRWAEPLHRDVGHYAAGSGISVLIGIRGAARNMVDAAIEAGLAGDAAYFFSDPEPAGRKLKELARPGDAILFKGSRGTHVENALEAFLN